MSKKDHKKGKKQPAIVFIGPSGVGKKALIEQLAKHFEDSAGKKSDTRDIPRGHFLTTDKDFADEQARLLCRDV